MLYSVLVRRYANAFLNIFGKNINDQELININKLANYIKNNKSVFFYINISLLTSSEKIKLTNLLVKKFNINNILEPLVNLLAKDNRLSLFPVILEKIVILYKQQNNILDFDIISAVQLSQEETANIKNFLEKNTGKKINYSYKIDDNLIAGIRLVSNNFLWEKSVAKYLRRVATVNF